MYDTHNAADIGVRLERSPGMVAFTRNMEVSICNRSN